MHTMKKNVKKELVDVSKIKERLERIIVDYDFIKLTSNILWKYLNIYLYIYVVQDRELELKVIPDIKRFRKKSFLRLR